MSGHVALLCMLPAGDGAGWAARGRGRGGAGVRARARRERRGGTTPLSFPPPHRPTAGSSLNPLPLAFAEPPSGGRSKTTTVVRKVILPPFAFVAPLHLHPTSADPSHPSYQPQDPT